MIQIFFFQFSGFSFQFHILSCTFIFNFDEVQFIFSVVASSFGDISKETIGKFKFIKIRLCFRLKVLWS